MGRIPIYLAPIVLLVFEVMIRFIAACTALSTHPMETQELAGAIVASAGIGLLIPLTTGRKPETEERIQPSGLKVRVQIIPEDQARFIHLCWGGVFVSLICWIIGFAFAITGPHSAPCTATHEIEVEWPPWFVWIGFIPYVLGVAFTEWKERLP
jgi:hypothetical protein